MTTKEATKMEASERVALLEAALRPFAFFNSPHNFHSTDGGCTEVLIEDADVQAARKALESEWNKNLRDRPANQNGINLP